MSIHLSPGGGASEILQSGVTCVANPLNYERIMIMPGEDALKMQINFFKNIDHPRYKELQKACGADQGDHLNEGQLRDAFYVWCAECGGATHFLTTDFKLVEIVRRHRTTPPRVRVVTPSELLDEIGQTQSA